MTQETSVDSVGDNRSDVGSGGERAWAMPELGAPGEFDDRSTSSSTAGLSSPIDGSDSIGGHPHQRWDEIKRDRSKVIAHGAPPLPVPLEPMTVSDMLDGAWAVLKSNPRTVLSITAVIIVPIEVISAFLQHRVSRGFDFSSLFITQPSTGRTAAIGGGLIAMAYAASALAGMSYFFLGGALARLVSAWYGGGDLTPRQAVMAAVRKGHIYIAAFVLVSIAQGISYLAFCVGELAVIPLLMLTAQTIMIEDLGPIAGARRSWSLVSRRFWWCVWIWILSWVIERVVNTMLSGIPGGLASLNIPGASAEFLIPAFAAFAKLVTAPFVASVSILMYLDLRVRFEGLDLELGAAQAFADAT